MNDLRGEVMKTTVLYVENNGGLLGASLMRSPGVHQGPKYIIARELLPDGFRVGDKVTITVDINQMKKTTDDLDRDLLMAQYPEVVSIDFCGCGVAVLWYPDGSHEHVDRPSSRGL